MFDVRKYETFLETQQHLLIYNKHTVMLDVRKYETFLGTQEHNGIIFTEIMEKRMVTGNGRKEKLSAFTN
jgi:hypothetical protein